MPIYKEMDYRVSIDAAQHLPEIFAIERYGVNSPMPAGGSISFDGYYVPDQSRLTHLQGTHSMSHCLNMLAQYTDLDLWIDNRNPSQKDYCNHAENPPTPHSIAEAKEYQAMYGLPTGKAWWSNHTPAEDSHTSFPFKHRMKLRLSPGARDYYYRLAIKWKMRSLSLSDYHSKSNYISACLEAIGSSWLLPPLGYKELLKYLPNRNMSSAHSKRKKERATNLERFSPENYIKLQELKANINNANRD